MPAVSIMVVDDEASVRESLSAFIEDRGFDVLSASSAEDALEKLGRNRVDIVIVDMRLPGMDGNSFIRKAYNNWPEVKFLVYTGSTNYSLPLSLADIGIRTEDVFRKPLHDMNVFIDAINRLSKKESGSR